MKKTRIIVAVVMTLTLCLSLAPTVLAAPDPELDIAAITKMLQVPEGTKYPDVSYVFEASPYAYNLSTEDTAKLPALGDDGKFEINFGTNLAPFKTEGGITTYIKESGDLLALGTGKVGFPNAGLYEYAIKETVTSPAIPADSIHEKMVMSEAEYLMTVTVREDDGVPYIYNISVKRSADDGGTPLTGNDAVKVDPTPGGDGDNSTPPYSAMVFTNKYIKTNGASNPLDPEDKNPDPRDPTDVDEEDETGNPDTDKPNYLDPRETTMNVIKRVSGDLASTSMPFKFSMTITVPDIIQEFKLDYYNAFIIGPEGFVTPDHVTGAVVIEQANGKDYIQVIPGEAVGFELKANEALFFTNTPVGTKYSVTETLATGYTTSIRVQSDGVKLSRISGLASGSQLAGEGFNAATYNNSFADPTAGGLNVNDLPFYGLILLAIGGLVLYVVIKARKGDRG